MAHSNLRSRRWTLVLLVLAAAVIVLERWHTYLEPLERDIAAYAVVGEEMLKGRALYSDLWDHKPPAIHATYALAEAVAGEGPRAVFLLNLLAALATLMGLFQAGKFLGGRTAGLWAAVIWAVVSGDLFLQANQPNEEAFLNPFQTWIFALWLSAGAKNFEPRRWLLLGALCSAASFYKPFALLEPLLLCAAYGLLHWNSPSSRKTAVGQGLVVFACGATAWAGLFFLFLLQGDLADFKEAVFTYNLSYSGYQGISFSDFLQSIGGQALGFSTLAWLFLLLVLGCGGAFLAKGKPEERSPWLLWGAFLIAAELEVLSPGHFFAHYDQLLLPPLILGAAWGVTALGERIEKKGWKCLPGAVLLAFLIFHEVPFYRLTPEQWADKKYAEGPVFAQAAQLGRELDGMLKPGETFYEWGNEPELYFAARRSPPSGIFYSYPLLNNPLALELSQRTVKDLEKTRPEVIVLNTTYYLSQDLAQRHPVLQWIFQNYLPLPRNPGQAPFALLMLKDGNLEKRMTAAKP